MQIPLIKISMGVFRQWKSSKLGIEMELRNRILIHQTCQEWSNPVVIQRQLQTIYMILDNPLYCISRISSPCCSWLPVRLHLGLQVSHLWNGSNFVMLNLLRVNLVLSIWQSSSRNVNDWKKPFEWSSWNEFTWYCCAVAEILCWCIVAMVVLWEKVIT